MKNVLSLLLAALLAILPASGALAQNLSLTKRLWSMNDWSFLADWGILTAEEAALFHADRTAVENGRELVRTAKLATGPLMGEAAFDDTLVALLERVTIISRARLHEGSFELQADGETLATVALGEQDGLYRLGSSLLKAPVALTAEDVSVLPSRLVTAMQANGLVSSQEAMQFGMVFAAMSGSSYGMLLQLATMDPADYPSLDLTAWNTTLSAIQGRMMYTPAAQEYAECDPAAEMWTLTVTPKDVRDLVVAGFVTVRDNPALVELLTELTGYERTAAIYGLQSSFEEEFLNPLITGLQEDEELFPGAFALTGYENAAGELVRLEILILDTSAQEKTPEVTIGTDSDLADLADLFGLAQPQPAVVLQMVYNRRTTEAAVTHELLFGDDRLEVYAEYICAAPHDMYVVDHRIGFGGLAEDGTRDQELTASLCAVVNRTIPGLTEAQVELSLIWPAYTMSYEQEYAQQDYSLIISVMKGGVNEHFPKDGASITLRNHYRSGEREMSDVSYSVSYDLDGVDLTGTERFNVSYEGEEMLSYTADVHTQPMEGSLFEGEAIRLSALTDDGLAAWVGEVKAGTESWYAAQQSGWLGDLVRFVESLQAEKEPEIKTTSLFELDADYPTEVSQTLPEEVQLSVDPLQITLYGHSPSVSPWSWVMFQDDALESVRIDSEYVSDFTPSYEGEPMPPDTGGRWILTAEGLQEGWAALELSREYSLTGERMVVYVTLEVDAQGNVTPGECMTMRYE